MKDLLKDLTIMELGIEEPFITKNKFLRVLLTLWIPIKYFGNVAIMLSPFIWIFSGFGIMPILLNWEDNYFEFISWWAWLIIAWNFYVIVRIVMDKVNQ